MILKVQIAGADATAEKLQAINAQIQKMNCELSVLREMVSALPPFELSTKENVPPET